MQCLKIEELLSPYLDGILSPAEREDVASHLAVCTNCREKFEALSEVVDIMKNLPEIAPPPEFSALVMAKVAADKKTGRAAIFKNFNKNNWSRAFSLVAAFVLVFGVTALLYGMPGQWRNIITTVNVHRNETITDDQINNDKRVDISFIEQTSESSEPPGSDRSDHGETGLMEDKPERASQPVDVTGDDVPVPAGAPVIPQKMAEKEGAIFQQVAYGNVPAAGKESSNLVRSATLALSTEDPCVVPEKISDLADDNGGYLESGDPDSGTFAVKVPADRFQNVLNGIREMGGTNTSLITNQDVSEQLYSYEDNIRELANEEQMLLVAMDRASSPVESQAARARLAKVRNDMENQKKLHGKLLNDTKLATIIVNLR